MTKPLPRFDFLGRRPDPRQLLEPLPPLLVERLADAPELAQHVELVGHYQAAEKKAVKLAAQLEQVKAEDAEGRLAALSAGRKVPKARADAAEVELAEARGDVEMLGQVVVESATRLLAASVPHLADAGDEAREAVEACLDEVGSLIVAAEAALDRAATASTESGWLAQLIRDGTVTSWSGPRPTAQVAPSARQLIAQASQALDHDRGRVAEERERAELTRAAALDLPPGSVIWNVGGGPDQVVTEEGEVVPVEEAQR